MLFLDISQLLKIDPLHSIQEEDLHILPSEIEELLNKIHARKQGFYEIIDQDISEIQGFANQNRDSYEHFVVCGIGGSSLGTICLQKALTHLYTQPKLHVLDNIDPTIIEEIEDVIDYDKTLFIIISKSGNTAEILSQYQYFRSKAPKENFVFITGSQGKLKDIAKTENIPSFPVPENVGGRFSVLTAVGLLPASLLNINIEKLLQGARQMRDRFLSTDHKKNLPLALAKIQHSLAKKGKNINVMMPYSQKLFRLADWYKQLLAESIGKKLDNNNNEVHTGITPVNALGVTDQHSQTQLYNEGPNDKLIIFIEVQNLTKEIKIPGEKHSFNKLMQVSLQGTSGSLTQNQRPNLTIKINSINEETLGELFMLFEASIAFLGEFYNINAFDQPGVELSKQLTREALGK